MSSQNPSVPTFKLVLGKHTVANYLATPASDHPLNFLIDNVHSVFDDPIPQLFAFWPRTSSEILLDCAQLATVELAKPLSLR